MTIFPTFRFGYFSRYFIHMVRTQGVYLTIQHAFLQKHFPRASELLFKSLPSLNFHTVLFKSLPSFNFHTVRSVSYYLEVGTNEENHFHDKKMKDTFFLIVPPAHVKCTKARFAVHG